MDNKKLWYIVAAAGAILILAGILAYKFFYENETLPSIENVQKVEQETMAEQEVISESETSEATEPKKEVIIKTIDKKITPPKPKAKAPAINPKYIRETSVQETSYERKYTPEEEEALKNEPTSKVVVVDKEIKLKSSGKYYFK